MKDIEKTLNILKKYGDKGIHSFLLNQEVGTTRSAARVNDLKKLGYTISSKKEQLNGTWGVRYTLLNSPVEHKPTYRFDAERQVFIYG